MEKLNSGSSESTQEFFFTQRLDHFVQKTPVWQQVSTWLTSIKIIIHKTLIYKYLKKKRYFVNNQYFSGTGPVILYIEGEAPLDPLILTETRIDFYAKRYVKHGFIISLFKVFIVFFGINVFFFFIQTRVLYDVFFVISTNKLRIA
jgi:hypothetical protein